MEIARRLVLPPLPCQRERSSVIRFPSRDTCPPAPAPNPDRARASLPAGGDLGWARRKFLPVLRKRHEGRALPFRHRRKAGGRADRAAGIHRRDLPWLSAGG